MAKAQTNPWESGRRKRRDNKFFEKRDAVLRAAAALFRERGYDRASLNDLADILKITKPTIYYYVNSKEQLLLDIVRSAQDQILSSLNEAAASSATGYEKLRKVMIDYVLVMISDQGACMARIPPAPRTRARTEVENRIEEGERLIYRILEQGEQDGTLRFSDRTVALQTLYGSLNWATYWAKPSGRLGPRQLAEAQVELLLNGVRGPAVAAEPVTPAEAKTPAKGRRRA